MGRRSKKVLLVSTVKKMLESVGWADCMTFNKDFIFKNSDGEVLAIPQHPKKPQLLYLDDLLRSTPVLRQEFVNLASPEWDLSDDQDEPMQFEIWLDAGRADESDIQAFFSSLSEMDRALGGLGYEFEEV